MKPALHFASATFLASFVLTGCTSAEPIQCDAGLVLFRGACVDPVRRYEPAAQLDPNNVVDYGDELTALRDLPPPPKSGFRIAAPPRTLAPGEEINFCLSWPIPDLTNSVVYGARVYTTPGLHHSNVLAKPIQDGLGPNPYPNCHPDASNPFSSIGSGIPDVLFANSTQVQGEESISFPDGMGYVLDTKREISADVHLLNTRTDPQRIEVVYDFFTMPRSELTQEVAPFLSSVNEFFIPPHTNEVVGASCVVFGGHVTMLMPHTHDLAQRFTVDLIPYDGEPRRVFDDGAFDLESDIRGFNPAFSLDEVAMIRHECAFSNSYGFEVEYGIGKNEMCMLFGYIYPPEKQFAAVVSKDGGPCNSLQLGLFR